MRKNDPTTPLLALLRSLTDEQRETLAKNAGTTVSYLYSLATCQRASCRTKLAIKIEEAAKLMHQETLGVSPIVTMQELATMCAVATGD